MIETTATMKPAGFYGTRTRGWDSDDDPANDPTYPYRNRLRDDHSGAWTRPAIQQVQVEILQSIEHRQRPAVVGTSVPPSGLSGSLRRLAFRKSESNLLHWMLLLMADRINMMEGVLSDLLHARLPHFAREMGMRSEWRFNRAGLLMKMALVIGLVALVAVAVVAALD